MRMLSKTDLLGQQSDRVALKDNQHVYRACSMAFAQSLGFPRRDRTCSAFTGQSNHVFCPG